MAKRSAGILIYRYGARGIEAFFRLHQDSRVIGCEPLNRRIPKEGERRLFELDDDFAAPRSERFAGAQIERDSSPTRSLI